MNVYFHWTEDALKTKNRKSIDKTIKIIAKYKFSQELYTAIHVIPEAIDPQLRKNPKISREHHLSSSSSVVYEIVKPLNKLFFMRISSAPSKQVTKPIAAVSQEALDTR